MFNYSFYFTFEQIKHSILLTLHKIAEKNTFSALFSNISLVFVMCGGKEKVPPVHVDAIVIEKTPTYHPSNQPCQLPKVEQDTPGALDLRLPESLFPGNGELGVDCGLLDGTSRGKGVSICPSLVSAGRHNSRLDSGSFIFIPHMIV